MKIVNKTKNSDIATVYIAKTQAGKFIEFVESTQPPFTRAEKWVLIVSTMFGCPVGCQMCDAGGAYNGKLSKDEMLWQINYLVTRDYPDLKVTADKFKIQFARMGEPALNTEVLKVLDELPQLYDAPGLLPSISTVAPKGTEDFFTQLIAIKNRHYSNGNFQLQFSLHTTDQDFRDQLIPIKKWSFTEIATYAEKFLSHDDRKVTLNFALSAEYKFEVSELQKYFSPELFIIKITPVNPTLKAQENNLGSYIKSGIDDDKNHLIAELEQAGYDVLLSVGELEENKIGSNCGQYIRRFIDSKQKIAGSYEYDVESA